MSIVVLQKDPELATQHGNAVLDFQNRIQLSIGLLLPLI
ncbi:Uncharacterised protein [Vibrio cholerae]|uniref:Uncharacterized protein n=1 Tax=Vibrio cholerae TaxID=666 RepID=A0A655WH50_VIBCL|nr:Uncharacterised protein [Vibrio cholerae]CSA43203.1 Uncharacterised protein [Vibrio cholerae]CSA57099.1 Uncharacterised protein [Vibrio cholerae]CSB49968.1 Uncharacterised protein [Vibrio cholerae]CSB55598.1 Uncharacterised protein [Vibrio cholerae]